MSDAESRLRKLLDTVLSGAQSDEQANELRLLLDDHPELRSYVAEQLRTHSLLLWEMSPTALTQPEGTTQPEGSAALRTDAPQSGAAGTGSSRQSGAPLARPSAHSKGATWTAMLAVAACFAAVVWVYYPRLPDAVAIGQFRLAEGVTLTANTSALCDGERLVPGVLEIESGSVAIEFASGVEMDITGPARCQVVSGMLVRLDHGQATAQVPRWARGFTVETPDVGVVDLGTRFGVARGRSGKTDVVVFEGEVDLKSLPNGANQFERRLTQGEAARINSRGAVERIFEVHGEWTGNGWSTSRRPENDALIAAVWDNFGASKSVSYYQVLPDGLEEDAPSYVDHPHQWNGLDRSGLPGFLAGAEYVRTVNDYRYRGELVIQMEFARDANLFIFFDNRVETPDWLAENYEDTGADIGLDEDAWHGNPEFTVATGAGESIDNVFSVWRRPFRSGEVVVLGSMGVGREARAMYGIAATPRDPNL